MTIGRSSFAYLVAPLVVGLASAQAGVGTKLPQIELEDFAQTPAKSFDDYSGRAIMLDFFAYWCGPCAASVPHVNEIQETWGPRGLSVIGVTDESASLTEPWVSAHKVAYAYAYDKGGELASHFSVNSIPRAIVVDASGNVLYNGHPGALDESVLEAAVRGALPKPMWEWSGAAKGVKSALQKEDFKTALERAGELGEQDDGPAILAAIQGMVRAKIGALRAARERGDYLGALAAAGTLEKSFAGLPEGEEAARIAAEIEADPRAAEIIKVQKKIVKIEEKDPGKKRELLAAIEDLKAYKNEYRDTYVAEQAAQLIKVYTARLSN